MDQHHARLILRFVRYHEMIGEGKKDSPAAVVDAPAEARRLREAKAVGTSPSEGGKTPTIERKGNSLFKVF